MSSPTVAICPARDVEPEVVTAAAQALEDELGLRTIPGPRVSLPPEAFDAARGQARAELVLAALSLVPVATLVLGVVAVDLYTPGLNFVFGMAAGRRALVSTARLRQASPAHDSQVRLLRRVAIEAVHEIGHCLGLGHCSNPRCVMYFSNTLADTDGKGSALCAECRAALAVAPSQTRPGRRD